MRRPDRMLILQAFFLWLIVSTLMVGGAMAFHRLYPNESPWFGFLVPPLALVLLLNFIEHLVALPVLLLLLPLFLGATVWMLARNFWKRPLLLPTGVFLASFAFTFAVRCLQPDISYTSDGISDLNMVNNYSQGQTLPPPDCWMPPFRFEWYYGLQHYAASVMKRLLDVKIGVAYNVSHALLSSLICVAAAGAAHRLSGGRAWITLAVPFLIEAAATGSSAYLFITSRTTDVWMPADLSGGMSNPPDDNPIWKLLAADPRREILRLQVPGFWTWRDEYHANASGHLLTVLAIFVLAELAHARRTIWPWVLAVTTPLLAVVASAWALPITLLVCWVTLPVAWLLGRRPASAGATALTLAVSLMLLWPAFYNASSSPAVPELMLTKPEWRVPLLEFVIQWWPILLLWICACVSWQRLTFGVRWVLFVVPLMLILIEVFTIQSRYNTVEKGWGYTWAAGLVAFFPIVAARAGIAFRLATIVLLLSALVSLATFTRDVCGSNWDDSRFRLEGTRYITNDAQKDRILQVLQQTRHAVYLAGKSAFCYNEAPALPAFTGNKCYIAWYWFESLTNYQSEADYRRKLNDDFYSGAMTGRLRFLQSNDITGVLIWPDDNLSDDYLAGLRQELEPAYEYIDCKGAGPNNAGVFLLRPLPASATR